MAERYRSTSIHTAIWSTWTGTLAAATYSPPTASPTGRDSPGLPTSRSRVGGEPSLGRGLVAHTPGRASAPKTVAVAENCTNSYVCSIRTRTVSESLLDYAKSRAGEYLRVVATYSAADYRLEYVRDDVRERYAEATIRMVTDELAEAETTSETLQTVSARSTRASDCSPRPAWSTSGRPTPTAASSSASTPARQRTSSSSSRSVPRGGVPPPTERRRSAAPTLLYQGEPPHLWTPRIDARNRKQAARSRPNDNA